LFLAAMALFMWGCAGAPTPSPAPPTALAILSTFSTATVGEIYVQQLTAAGGTRPYTWIVTAGAFPNGLTMTPSGLVSGIPTKAGDFTLTIQVVDSALSVVQIQTKGKIDETP
jgi:hypothetical protein